VKREKADRQPKPLIGNGLFGLGYAAGQQKELDQCHFSTRLSVGVRKSPGTQAELAAPGNSV
jgi:hypothetical protein